MKIITFKVSGKPFAEARLIMEIRNKWEVGSGGIVVSYVFVIKDLNKKEEYGVKIDIKEIGNGKRFVRCDYSFQHIYTRNQWHILTFINELITTLMEED